MKFGFVDGHRQVWPCRVMCSVRGLSASDHYAWPDRPESRRSVANRELTEDIRLIHAESRAATMRASAIHLAWSRHWAISAPSRLNAERLNPVHLCAGRSPARKRTF